MSKIHVGSCFCGAVKIEVTGQPEAMGYCHCSDCSGWAGAPINAFSLWSSDAVKVTAGADKLGSFAKTETSHRKFCTQCGGHIMCAHPEMGKTDVYLNTVPGLEHKGAFHVFYGEKTMSVPDGLPKFKDLPAEFGGSGEIFEEYVDSQFKPYSEVSDDDYRYGTERKLVAQFRIVGAGTVI